VGLFGFGDDKQVKDTRSALEQARDPRPQGDVVTGTATRLVENLLDVGIDGKGPFKGADRVAREALQAAGGDVEKAIDKVISSHRTRAAGAGFITSLGGFVTLPVALPANVVEFYLLTTRMTAAIAKLRGYDISQQQIRSAVLLSLVGADAQDLLSKAGVVATGRLSNLAAQRLPGPALMVVNKAVGFRLLSTAGKGVFSRFGKNVPIVGGVVGAGIDTWLLHRIAESAREEFPTAPPQITAR
jgi:hypothetical protein